MEGLRELVNYMHMAKTTQGVYALQKDIPIKGMLCIGDVHLNNNNNLDVSICTMGESKDILKQNLLKIYK